MSWSSCGQDSKGRFIGYAHAGTCDHPGCDKKINRGLSYACGDMHGETEYGCEKYFCSEHRENIVENNDEVVRICDECKKILLDSGDWKVDKNEGTLVYVPEPEESKTYTFTFGFGHTDKDGVSLGNRYAQATGTYGEARQAIVDRRGDKWAFQYDEADLAGVQQFNLQPISLEEIQLPEDMRG